MTIIWVNIIIITLISYVRPLYLAFKYMYELFGFIQSRELITVCSPFIMTRLCVCVCMLSCFLVYLYPDSHQSCSCTVKIGHCPLSRKPEMAGSRNVGYWNVRAPEMQGIGMCGVQAGMCGAVQATTVYKGRNLLAEMSW